jgi:hypothetical protein
MIHGPDQQLDEQLDYHSNPLERAVHQYDISGMQHLSISILQCTEIQAATERQKASIMNLELHHQQIWQIFAMQKKGLG